MPLDAYTIKAGTTGKVLLLFLADVASGAGRVGLRHDTAGATAAFVREGDDRAHRIDLVEGTLGHHRPGGFVEVDPGLLPGVYQFGCPDELLAPGATRAVLMLSFPDVAAGPVEVELVAYDSQDPVQLGMSALTPQGRIRALHGAFPNLARREIREAEATQEPG
jgi:hypothetical protein